MEIPDNKRFFRIGETSRIIGVKPYVLRYWEKEFQNIRPKRADSRQRTYQREDIETIGEIKKLLYEEKLTIHGAKKRLKSGKKVSSAPPNTLLKEIKEELTQILKMLQ
ncbi:MAG: MerR family transcriptional regulator [Deltaproteobacteria bacterium]|nr:MerR family transcriptional regulator [Deltaproteobacteria bacterium]MBW2333720.1 MerR family transcriptional regulator [Deltaproteobacteria bacterium]